MKEIGSEFSNYDLNQSLNFKVPLDLVDYTFTFSGRTAISVILKNIPNIKKALLPSYCCDSIIDPFRKANIKIYFYDVNYVNGLNVDIDIPDDIDLIFWCNYFGYKHVMPNFNNFIMNGGIIIEDITHSLFSSQQYNLQSQYLVASLRKWGPLLSGGFCASTKNALKNKPRKEPPTVFINKKKEAMMLKEQYLKNYSYKKKEIFLSLFNECNQWLSNNYMDLTIDSFSKKILFSKKDNSIKLQRVSNAIYLQNNLKNHPDIKPIFNDEEIDCPLFVPVVVKNGKRDFYRKKLIENNIYCPVHWPHPHANCESNLYELELSLICDQRYSKEDMKRIISILYE